MKCYRSYDKLLGVCQGQTTATHFTGHLLSANTQLLCDYFTPFTLPLAFKHCQTIICEDLTQANWSANSLTMHYIQLHVVSKTVSIVFLTVLLNIYQNYVTTASLCLHKPFWKKANPQILSRKKTSLKISEDMGQIPTVTIRQQTGCLSSLSAAQYT